MMNNNINAIRTMERINNIIEELKQLQNEMDVLMNNDYDNDLDSYKMKSAQLESELMLIGKEIENFIDKTELYMESIDNKYKNRLRDMELINSVKEKEQEMVTLINKINVIELKAVPLKDRGLMMKCECKKAKLTNLMMCMQSKYGC